MNVNGNLKPKIVLDHLCRAGLEGAGIDTVA